MTHVPGFAIGFGTTLTLLGVAGLHGGCMFGLCLAAVLVGVALVVWGGGLSAVRETSQPTRGMTSPARKQPVRNG